MTSYDEDTLLANWMQQGGGLNLEYDARFLALQQAATEKPEQQFGNTIIEAQAPDWSQVLKQAEDLLQETADLRVLLLHTWAQVERSGLQAYADGLGLLLRLFHEMWDDLHPSLEEEGEVDPFPRMNVLGAFIDMQGLFKAVRASMLLSGQHGFLSLRDAENVIEGSRPELFAGGRLRLQELLKQAKQDPLSPMSMLLLIEQRLETLHDLIHEKLDAEWGPDFSVALLCIRSVTQLVAYADTPPDVAQELQPEACSSAPAVSSNGAVQPAASVRWEEVSLKNREEAMLMLEKICSYFETHEPSHPAPFLLKRVQQTIPMRFPEILQNLIPSGADQFEIWMPKEG